MEASVEEKLNQGHDLHSENRLNQEFYEFLKLNEDSPDDVKLEESRTFYNEDEEVEEEEEEEEEEFSFVCGGENTSAIAAEDAFNDGQIKTVFPLFNQELLFSGDDSESLHENLPLMPPVKKVFVERGERNGQVTSSTPRNDEIVGPCCELSSRKVVEASPEVCNKSNSTGFSKIWRVKEFRERCNSDGRDAFVFLKSSHAPSTAKKQPAVKAEETRAKTDSKVKKSGKSKTASAHEVYLKSKAKDPEERRRSYLPYRPELMGFFTNYSGGGLTKNVHPY